jgi:hypothetical protein
MANKIDNILKQTYRYFYEDGLVEMAVGFLFVAVGLVLLAWQSLNDSPLVMLILVVGFVAVVIGGAYLIKRLVREIKQRLTYPRTGYVAYRQGEPAKGRWFVPLAALALLVASLFLPEDFMEMSAMMGALLAVILAFMGYRVGLWRFYAVAIIALVSGVALAWLNVVELIAVSLTFIISGAALFLAGALAFAGYLRRHPQPHEELS